MLQQLFLGGSICLGRHDLDRADASHLLVIVGMLVWLMFADWSIVSTYWKGRGNASYDRVNELLHEKTHIVEQLGAVQTPGLKAG